MAGGRCYTAAAHQSMATGVRFFRRLGFDLTQVCLAGLSLFYLGT